MLDVISALIPMLVVGALFVAVAVTAIRATDGANRREGRAGRSADPRPGASRNREPRPGPDPRVEPRDGRDGPGPTPEPHPRDDATS